MPFTTDILVPALIVGLLLVLIAQNREAVAALFAPPAETGPLTSESQVLVGQSMEFMRTGNRRLRLGGFGRPACIVRYPRRKEADEERRSQRLCFGVQNALAWVIDRAWAG